MTTPTTGPSRVEVPPNSAKTIAKIEKGGGKICVPKMTIPDVGLLAYAEDPTGNIFGILEPKSDGK